MDVEIHSAFSPRSSTYWVELDWSFPPLVAYLAVLSCKGKRTLLGISSDAALNPCVVPTGEAAPCFDSRATSNHKVKETVALELSYVNSNLQLLKEELEELNSCMDVYQNDR